MTSPDSPTAIRELDVRPILAAGGAPIGAILQAVGALAPGQSLRLIAPFEPVPLYAKLGDAGFDHETTVLEDGAFSILFKPRAKSPEAVPVLLDLRHLEPPEPMQRALEALAQLPPDGVLIAITRFRPVHLLDVLESRGLVHETAEQADSSWETVVANSPCGRAT